MNEREERPRERIKDKSKGKSKSWSNQKKTSKCYKCHQVRHYKRNCPLPKIEKGKGILKGTLANMDANSSKDSEDDLLVVSYGSM